jgi:lipid-A-disaccharide synthase
MEHARVFTAYHGMAEDIDAKLKVPAQVIGDLVKDSLSLERGNEAIEAPRGSDAPHVLFFPGSRPAIRNLSLKWLAKVVKRLKILIPDVRFTTLFSPFVPENDFPVWENAGLNPVRSGAAAAMKTADYALTQPGTNTLEMMHCGLPALVAAPLDFLDVAPVGGLGKFVFGVPLAGLALKEWKMRKNLERYGGFLSWPNRLAGQPILDEIMGKLTPGDLAEHIAEALKDKKKLSSAKAGLLALSGDGGAAARLCDAVENA